MSETSAQRYLTPQQAAKYLGLSVWSVYRLVGRRAIPFIALKPSGPGNGDGRASMRFDSIALDRWMQKHVVPAVPEQIDLQTRNCL